MMRGRTLILIFCILSSLLYGCEAKARYKVLSFFFDGVPDPEKVALEEKAARDKGRSVITGEPGTKITTHGPYAAKACDACHEKFTNNLLLPPQELCFKCHTINIDKRWVHGPVAAGGCGVCHEPHESRYPFLLVSTPREFCFHCHNKDSLLKSEAHKDTEAICTNCHDAHASDRRFLLK